MKLLSQLEGCRLHAYDDATGAEAAPGADVSGALTIGYGHTGPDVVPGLVWSADQAEKALDADTRHAAGGVSKLLVRELGGNQFSALACLAFNIGLSAFAGSSALHFANSRELGEVPTHLSLWNKALANGRLVVSPGLVGRRAAETALWHLPDHAVAPDFAAIRDAAVTAYRRIHQA